MRKFDYSFLNNGMLPASLVTLTSNIAVLKTMAGVRKEEYAKLLSEKKAAYAEYRHSRDEMRELLLHKQNVDRMLGKNERE